MTLSTRVCLFEFFQKYSGKCLPCFEESTLKIEVNAVFF